METVGFGRLTASSQIWPPPTEQQTQFSRLNLSISAHSRPRGSEGINRDAMICRVAGQPEGDPEQAAAGFVIKTSQELPVEVAKFRHLAHPSARQQLH